MFKHNYDAERVLYIGDSLSDYIDSKTANIPFLGRILTDSDNYFPNDVSVIDNFKELL